MSKTTLEILEELEALVPDLDPDLSRSSAPLRCLDRRLEKLWNDGQPKDNRLCFLLDELREDLVDLPYRVRSIQNNIRRLKDLLNDDE